MPRASHKVEKALVGVDRAWTRSSVNLATRTAHVAGAPEADVEPSDPRRSGAPATSRTRHDAGRAAGGRGAPIPPRRLIVAVALHDPGADLSSRCCRRIAVERGLAWILATPVVFYAGWPFLRSAAAGGAPRHHDDGHADRARRAGRLRLQRLGRGGGRRRRPLLRHRRGDRDADPAWVRRWRRGRARHAGDAARTLLERGAKEATVLEPAGERRVPIEELRPGSVVVVAAGREDPRGRRRAGGDVVGGPLAAHRRVGAGRRRPRGARSSARRSTGPGGWSSSSPRSGRTRSWPRSSDCSRRHRARRRRSSGSPTASRRSSSRP